MPDNLDYSQLNKPTELLEHLQSTTKFIRDILWASGDWCNTIDGGHLQDMAEKAGLIEQVTVEEPCCEQCACAEMFGTDEFPVQCYRYVDWLKEKTNA